jgi:hypothetical protein
VSIVDDHIFYLPFKDLIRQIGYLILLFEIDNIRSVHRDGLFLQLDDDVLKILKISVINKNDL